jgi:hypothetical protein
LKIAKARRACAAFGIAAGQRIVCHPITTRGEGVANPQDRWTRSTSARNRSSDDGEDQRRASRRRFLEAGIAVGAAGIIGMPLASTQQPAPKRGGVLKLAVPVPPAASIPPMALARNLSSARHLRQPGAGGCQLNPSRTRDDWSVSSDGKVWTFNLRRV